MSLSLSSSDYMMHLDSDKAIGMPEYIRWVSIYTGPGQHATLKDEYQTALDRLRFSSSNAQNIVLYNDEDIRPEDDYIRYAQLFSHLLIKVTVSKKDVVDGDIYYLAASTLHKLLMGSYNGSEKEYWLVNSVRNIYEKNYHMVKIDPGYHPIFNGQAKPMYEVPPLYWTPDDVERQYRQYPKSCAEDPISRAARKERQTNPDSTPVAFCRNSKGDLEVILRQNDITVTVTPWKQHFCPCIGDRAGEINY